MVQVNPGNILNMLILFQISKIPEISINDKEIELRDVIKDVIHSSMNKVSCDIHTTLEFENYWESNLLDADFVSDDKAQIDLSSFKASATWILNYKRKHRIASRKIIKFVSRSA